MIQVLFRTKIQRVYRMDGTLAREFIKVPERARQYVDEHSIGEFPSIIWLDDIPNDQAYNDFTVTVNVSGNFATVIIEC